MSKTLLVITDGIGHSPKQDFNAFYHAKTPTYDWLFANVPHALIQTHGESVGLPKGQMGNSEVGHMTLGLGYIIFQDLLKISQGLANRSLFQTASFQTLAMHTRIHIAILLSDGGVHSHIEHLFDVLKELQTQKIFLHLIGDGRDVAPQSLQNYLHMLSPYLNDRVKIATLSGRYYAMDRDQRWERTKLAYDCIISASPQSLLSPEEYVKQSYTEGIFDEFIKPTAFVGYSGVRENDAIFFLNFRSDRMRQLSYAIASKSFSHFPHHPYSNLYCLCTNVYDENFPLPSLLQKEFPSQSLSSIIAQNHLKQAHIAETEKYAHVTFFFNGGIEAPYPGEDRFLIPSPKVSTYDLCPQMSAKQVGDQVLECMKQAYDFIVVNFANGDMVGHTGVFEAGIKAVETVDTELGRIIELAKELNYSIVLTSDHGNCEEMKDERGNILTNHTVGDVWCFILDAQVHSIQNGTLANIAPSVLKIMGLPIPSQMEKPLF